MPQLNAYLSFNGNCAEAMRFYEKTLNGKLEMMLTFAETPAAGQTAPEDAKKIMHAHLIIEGQSLMAADAPSGMKPKLMKGCALALSYDSADEAKRVFDALGEGGKDHYAIRPSF